MVRFEYDIKCSGYAAKAGKTKVVRGRESAPRERARRIEKNEHPTIKTKADNKKTNKI